MPRPQDIHSPETKKGTEAENYDQIDGAIKTGSQESREERKGSEQGCRQSPPEEVRC